MAIGLVHSSVSGVVCVVVVVVVAAPFRHGVWRFMLLPFRDSESYPVFDVDLFTRKCKYLYIHLCHLALLKSMLIILNVDQLTTRL